ncbi:30S ribosomal protein S11 [Candidatus Berkelbacteria bacterium RIFOXYA2_FULL_43_10]|uniref:Small ribosomal subunit protein uS11 n=1 Tax=Candidatus Berkelbacteria bacterium RIFOXYA2_FULL_43_10 TaxID=1797472 RepID=A0A1F5EAN3_9BACT|nr:MAG: 30S ribosomal protein S11 [Candidatus Berkelbacteria bacterium RIFOXYA2_FULL_43_10]
MAKAEIKKSQIKKRAKRNVSEGRIYIQSTFNNTIVSITDVDGNVISWASSGSLGFKGTKKSTPYAAQLASTSAIEKAKGFGLAKASVFVSGVGPGREAAVRSLSNAQITVDTIKDLTPSPHNGCRAKKSRRV